MKTNYKDTTFVLKIVLIEEVNSGVNVRYAISLAFSSVAIFGFKIISNEGYLKAKFYGAVVNLLNGENLSLQFCYQHFHLKRYQYQIAAQI